MQTKSGVAAADDGGAIAWVRYGSPDAPAVVLIHGIGNDGRSWSGIPEALAAAGRQVVTLDLRGHGASTRQGPHGIEQYATDAAAVLRELGIRRPVLVGHSLGALVCTALAAAPDVAARAVVNVDQSLRLSGFAAILRSLWPQLRQDFHRTMVPVFESMLPAALPGVDRAMLRSDYAGMNSAAAIDLWGPLVEQDPLLIEATVDQLLAHCRLPYLAIHGSDPGADYAPWLRQRVDASSVEVWEGGAHFPHLAEPDRFVARLLAFPAS